MVAKQNSKKQLRERHQQEPEERVVQQPKHTVPPPQTEKAVASTSPSGHSLWFSPNPQKAAIERAWLEYSAVWCGLLGLVMLTGLGSYWSDPGLSLLGIVFMMGTYFWPVLRVNRHFHYPTLNAMFYGNVTLSFTMHYIATPFFFDVLHMRYGFQVEARIDRNPVFLYPLTVAYFSTYSVMSCIFLRRITNAFSGDVWSSSALGRLMGNALRGFGVVMVPFATALFETLLNANPFISDLFCYDDVRFAITFGTFAYGLGFVFSIPVWLHGVPDRLPVTSLAERQRPKSLFELFFSWKSRLWQNVFGQMMAEFAHGVCLYFLRHDIAPQFTTVVDNSSPFGGCLTPPREPWIKIG
jgi:cycloeucalenol cycloisomerase